MFVIAICYLLLLFQKVTKWGHQDSKFSFIHENSDDWSVMKRFIREYFFSIYVRTYHQYLYQYLSIVVFVSERWKHFHRYTNGTSDLVAPAPASSALIQNWIRMKRWNSKNNKIMITIIRTITITAPALTLWLKLLHPPDSHYLHMNHLHIFKSCTFSQIKEGVAQTLGLSRHFSFERWWVMPASFLL